MSKTKYNITKSICEKYVINFNKGFDYAVIFLDSGEKCGTISILSSYGNYAQHFSSTGIPFKDFIRQLDFDYFMKKTTENYMKFNTKKSIENFKKMVHIAFEDSDITELEKEQCLEEIENFNENVDNNDDIYYLYTLVEDTQFYTLFIHENFHEYLEKEVDVQCEGFWREIWPKFIEVLEKEKTNME